MTIEIEPLSEALGARVYGVDLSETMDEATFRTVHRAWLDHQVLIFPAQAMSEADQVRFARLFGKLPQRPAHTRGTESGMSHDSIMLITNEQKDGRNIGALPNGEMFFHTDGSYDETPYRYTMLFALEVPSVGGNTLFADMYGAYETLRPDLKQRIDGLHAVHGFYAGRAVTPAFRAALDVGDDPVRTTHPIAIAHDETGRTALYVNRMLTERIAEMPGPQGDALLEELFAHSEQKALIYEHVWTRGDFVIWDNRCTNHARTDFPPTERRKLRRTTVQGVKPSAARLSAA